MSTSLLSEGYRRYLALCLGSSVSHLVSQLISAFLFFKTYNWQLRDYLGRWYLARAYKTLVVLVFYKKPNAWRVGLTFFKHLKFEAEKLLQFIKIQGLNFIVQILVKII